MLRIQSSFSLLIRRVPLFQTRIYASNTAPRSDDEWEDEKKAKDETSEDANIASMIGPYVSSKQIAFHTGQFDSEHIQKKNKQAFLVRSLLLSSDHFFIVPFHSFRMSSKLTKSSFPTVVAMSNSFELPFDV